MKNGTGGGQAGGRIYLDNACTTYPKPPRVAQAVYEYMTGVGANVNRGSYGAAYEAEETLYETRRLVCALFGGGEPRNVIFTKNVTESLNILLKGLLKPGDHVLVSSMEHNAVMRPLTQLGERGVTFSRVPCTREGQLCLEEMEGLLTERTRAVVMLHASNVCGTVLPLEEVGAFCARHGLLFLVDAAQTAGVLELDIEKMNIDALAFTGHKGLLGPQGTGGFLLRSGKLGEELEPLLSGGTGSFSHLETVPAPLPDRFEAGTLNLPGLCGLREGLLWLRETGLSEVRRREEELTARLLCGLKPLEEQELIRLVGLPGTGGRVGVVSVRTLRRELAQVAWELDETYGVQTRVGLHCAPSAHRSLGTFPEGTIRLSVGYFTTPEEIDRAAWALGQAARAR